MVARITEQPNDIRQPISVYVFGKSQAFVNIFFKPGQALAAGKSGSRACGKEMRRNTDSASFPLVSSQDTLDVRQISSDFACDRFVGMVGMKTCQDQFVGPDSVQPLRILI